MKSYSAYMFQKLHEYSWEKDAWFLGLEPSLKDVTSAEAAWEPPGGGNTIWQIVNHLNFYNEKILKELKGIDQPPPSLTNTETFGLKGQPNDSEGWAATLDATYRIANDLNVALENLRDEVLQEGHLGERLTAWIMHDAYHTGQIVLLRKLQGTWPAVRE